MARHRARRQAMQVLFEWDMRKGPLNERGLEEILMGYYTSLLVSDDSPTLPRRDEFAIALVRGVVGAAADIDEMITKHAEHWKIPRMPAVDRNILRIAVYEMMRTDTPPAVVIDEALELARQFSGEESVHFVNGVLDAVRREVARV
jgi:N utilization substance protein B